MEIDDDCIGFYIWIIIEDYFRLFDDVSSVQTCLSSGLAQKPLNIKTGELEESSQRQIIINIHFPP